MNSAVRGCGPRLLRVQPLADLPCRLVIDTHNVESLLASSIAAVTRSLLLRAGYSVLASNMAALEHRTLVLADRVWAASAEDAIWNLDHLGLPRVDVVPNALDPGPPLGPPREEKLVMMSGMFAYLPNKDAAVQLLKISRTLRARGLDHRLALVGRAPTRRMLTATRGLGHVEIAGEVKCIEPWMKRATVFAAPLRAGSGTKFKLLQAMLAGRAVVTTAVGARGLDLEHRRHALVC